MTTRRKKKPMGGESRQVTFRLPKTLHDRLERIAISIYQPLPAVMRMALAEYVRNHRPARHGHTGISLSWPLDSIPDTTPDCVTDPDTPLTPDEPTT